MDTIPTLRQLLTQTWLEYWLLRWVVANSLAWLFGMILAVAGVWLLGAWGALIAGAVLGASIGTGQAWILFTDDDRIHRHRWILLSAIGGFCGAFPAAALSLVGFVSGGLAALLVGGMFAGILGGLQSLLLVKLMDERGYLWIPICILGGALSAWLSLLVSSWGIPIALSPGSWLFALLTGMLILRWETDA
ncbi:MAG: hypothetical protein AAFR81_21085 [Chloroflexota bacterium]